MATAQLLTLTHGVDGKVTDIGDTVRVVRLYCQKEKTENQSYSRQQEKRQQLSNLWRTRSTKRRVRSPVTLTLLVH